MNRGFFKKGIPSKYEGQGIYKESFKDRLNNLTLEQDIKECLDELKKKEIPEDTKENFLNELNNLLKNFKWGKISGDICAQKDLSCELAKAGQTAAWGDIKGNIQAQCDLQRLVRDNIKDGLQWGQVKGYIQDQEDLTARIRKISQDYWKTDTAKKEMKNACKDVLGHSSEIATTIQSWSEDPKMYILLKKVIYPIIKDFFTVEKNKKEIKDLLAQLFADKDILKLIDK